MKKEWSGWAPLPLRLIIGIGLLYHGLPKVFTAGGHQQFAGLLQQIAIPAPQLAAWLVGLVEIVGGLALLAGAFVTIAATLLIIHQLVAIFKVHLAAGFSFIHITGMTNAGPQFGIPGYEVNLLYIAGLAALIAGGAGAVSFDRARAGREPPGPTQRPNPERPR